MMRRVVITGIGVVSSAGIGSEPLWAAARDGATCVGPLKVKEPYGGRVKIAAQVRDFDPVASLGARLASLLDPFTAYAVAAADQAIHMAGLDPNDRQGPRCATFIGSGIGGMNTLENGLHNLFVNDKRPDALTVPRLIPSSAPTQVSMRFGATGPCYTIASACSSGSQAIGTAYQMIKSGAIDRAIVGGSEACITNGTMRAWESLRVLSQSACKPFSKTRDGTVLGDGSAMFIVEAEEAALARGAKPLAVIIGYGTNSDAFDPVKPDMLSAAACMSMALADAGLTPADIDYINAHGTATGMNDSTEAAAINHAFGDETARLLVSSTKPIHGHALGAAGALELVISIMALRDQIAPPNINVDEQDPKCPVLLVGDKARETPIRAVMSNSLAFGGINASLIVAPYAAP